MSLLKYLLSGYGPESEMFIDKYVEQFNFINHDSKFAQFVQFDELYKFSPTSNITKKGSQIFDIMKNDMPNKIYEMIKTNAKNIMVTWNFDKYTGYENKLKNLTKCSDTFTNDKTTLTNFNIVECIYESFNRSMLKHIESHVESQFYTKIHYYIDGFNTFENNGVLYIFVHTNYDIQLEL